MSVSAWQAFAHAGELAMPHKVYQMAMIESWSNACRALREAGVAEAQLRIAQASLDEQLLKEVKEAITRMKGEQVAEALIEAPDLALAVEAVEVAPVIAAEMPTVKAEPKAAPRRSKGTKASKNGTRKAKADEAEKVTAEAAPKDEVAEPEPTPAAEVEELVDNNAAIEMWRFRETSRFRAKDEDFKGFASPPGRF
jgi:type IV secretory pathway VirB10-like protein